MPSKQEFSSFVALPIQSSVLTVAILHSVALRLSITRELNVLVAALLPEDLRFLSSVHLPPLNININFHPVKSVVACLALRMQQWDNLFAILLSRKIRGRVRKSVLQVVPAWMRGGQRFCTRKFLYFDP